MKKKRSGNSTKAQPGSAGIVGTPKSGRRLVSADRYHETENTLPTDRRALIRLLGIIGVCRDLQTQKARAEYLLHEFRDFPKLIWYFRQAYDHHIQFGLTSGMAANLTKKEARTAGVWQQFTELREILHHYRTGKLQGLPAKMAWRLFMAHLQPELRPVACHILDKDLNCGIAPTTLNRVLMKLDKTPVEVKPDHTVPADPALMKLEVTSAGGAIDRHSATAILWYDGDRVANIVFALCPKMRPALAVLRAAGITIEIPNYIRPQEFEK